MTDSIFGPEYTKIQSLFKRDTAKRGNPVTEWAWSLPEFEYLKDLPWRWTEKIDGTNTRLHWNGTDVTLGGRTDNAQIPAHLTDAIRRLGLFNENAWTEKWPYRPLTDNTSPPPSVTLYGEGYGPKIQKGGGLYRDDVSFILFDVLVGHWWLQPEDVKEIAEWFGIDVVPEWRVMSPVQAWTAVREGEVVSAKFPGAPLEGLVGTPVASLFNRKGQRIIAKTKNRDWDELQRSQAR